MALHVPANLAAGNVNAPQGSHGALTTPAFTPAAGARLFVLAAVARAGTTPATLSISDTAGHAWQLVGQDGFSPPAGGVSSAALWTTVASGAPTQVTVTPSIVGQLLFQILPFQAAADAGTPEVVQATMERTVTGPTWGVPFAEGPSAADSLAIGWVITGPQNGGVVPLAGSGFTEIYQGASDGIQTAQAQYRFGAADGTGWSGLTTTNATKYGFLVELAEPFAPPPPEREGSTHVAGGGRATTRGERASFGAALAAGGGSLSIAAEKTAVGAMSAAGGGHIHVAGVKTGASRTIAGGGGGVDPTGQKIAHAATTTAGGGSSVVVGAKHTAGGVAVSGGGSTHTAASKRAHATTVAAGGGSSSVSAAKHARGFVAVSGGGVVRTRGASVPIDERSGATLVAGGGSVRSAGRRESFGVSGVTAGGGASASTGRKSALVAVRVAGGGHVVTSHYRTSAGQVFVAGGGSVRTIGIGPDGPGEPVQLIEVTATMVRRIEAVATIGRRAEMEVTI